MNTVDKRVRVRELTDVPFPSLDAPDPLVLADEDFSWSATSQRRLRPSRAACRCR